ncbi:unnamed protein product, partial [Polarella glacialis]
MEPQPESRMPLRVPGLGLVAAACGSTAACLSRPLLQDVCGAVSPGSESIEAMTLFAGAFAGQLLAAELVDRHGRLRALRATAVLQFVGALGCVLSGLWLPQLLRPDVHSAPGCASSLRAELVVWQLMLGLGLGAEVVASFAYIAESWGAADSRGAAAALATAYCCLAAGRLLAAATCAFSLVLGAAPDLRRRRPERHSDAAWPLCRVLSGTCVAWFLQGFVLAGIAPLLGAGAGLWASATSGLWHGDDGDSFKRVMDELLAALLTLPGFAAISVVARLGPRASQLAGFAVTALGFAALAILQSGSIGAQDLQLALCAALLMAIAGGPGFTTLIIPAQLFPTCVRGACLGLSAACGSLG